MNATRIPLSLEDEDVALQDTAALGKSSGGFGEEEVGFAHRGD